MAGESTDGRYIILNKRSPKGESPIESFEDLPDLKGVRLVARLINKDDLNIQYILYFENETYTVDLSPDDYEEFSGYLDEKFKAAGVKPPLVKGTIQYFSDYEISTPVV